MTNKPNQTMPASPAGWAFVRPWLQGIDTLSMWLVILAMAAMTLMVSLQVFWRYILGSSIDSADELSRLFFVWVIFLAIPHGVKYGVHVGIDLFVLQLGEKAREVLARMMAGAGAVLLAAVFHSAWIATTDKWSELMPTLPVTAAVYYIAVLICAGHACLHLIAIVWAGTQAFDGEQL